MDLFVSALLSLALIAYLIQEIIKYYNQRGKETIIVVVIAGLLWLAVAFSYGINLVSILLEVFWFAYKISIFSSVVWEFLTGLSIGVGSGLFYDLMERYKKKQNEGIEE